METSSAKFITLQHKHFKREFERAHSILKKKNLLSSLLDENFLKYLKSLLFDVARGENVCDDVARLRDYYEVNEEFVKAKIGNEHYKDFLNNLKEKRRSYSILALGTLKEMQKRGHYYPKVKLITIAKKPY